ncbi:MAG: hypothetical protein ACF8NJ_04995, partial [Phycisphaerales bacterium JB038]
LAALGYGALAAPILRGGRHPGLLRFTFGLALLLSLSHLLAALGPLTNPWVARSVLALGLIMLLAQLLGSDTRLNQLARSFPPWALPATPAAALLCVACASLPGWLWLSEAHGYDVLEYHLQLPAEWLRLGRLQGLEHNVYSFLPNFMEAAYLHLASAVGSIHAADGLALLSAQFLHAGIALTAVVLLARAARVWRTGLAPANEEESTSLEPHWGALSAAFLALPWVIVVSAMAYNEMTVVLLCGGALVTLADAQLSPRTRCLLPAFLLGAASGAKLTAVFLGALPLALVAFFLLPWRTLARQALPSALLFLAPLLPWFGRNLVDAGQPLFPFLTGLLGSGHWSAEQVERWGGGHRFAGSFGDRLSAIWERGVAHPQWSFFFALILVAALVAILQRRTRRAALIALLLLGVQLLCWALFTHIQARFLLPTLLPAALLFGLALTLLPRPTAPAARRLLAAALCLPALAFTGHSYLLFANQRQGDPAAMLDPAAHAWRTGAAYDESPQLLLEQEPSPEYLLNFALPDDSLVYLVGGATPLYFTRPVLYHTTWDDSPLGLLLREHGDDHAAIAAGLRQRGVTHLLIDESEVQRLQGDGWYDPLVTLEVVREFAQAQGEVVQSWGHLTLLRLPAD